MKRSVTSEDAPPIPGCGHAGPPAVELIESRTSRIGGLEVRRALPRRPHRTVGSWCFADHLGPVPVTGPDAAELETLDIGPHPHIGLQTVTWLLAGGLVHRDSLGSEQLIRPGQLNLMTAGAGVVHAEEMERPASPELHGIQLWVAQPERTRHGAPAFEHHRDLPEVDLVGAGTATVLVGELAGTTSPARRDTDHVGADLDLRPGPSTVPLHRSHEHALIVLTGAVSIGDTVIEPGRLAYLGADRDEVTLTAPDEARVMLLGGRPFEEDIFMWWNFVARTRAEVAAAAGAWRTGGDRFGATGSRLPRIPAPAGPT